MSSVYVVTSPTSVPITTSLLVFEAWLARKFTDARIIERHVGARALAWTQSDDPPKQSLEGWISEDRVAIYLKGDLNLVCETAIAFVELFPDGTDVILVNDSQMVLFDLRGTIDAHRLADAVIEGDETFAWQGRM